MPKVVIAVTSYNKQFYQDGKKTGLFAVEAIHPFETFKAHGYDVEFVSETGTFGYDEHSLGEDALNGDDLAIYTNKNSDYSIGLKNIKKPSEINADEYDIFFASAGHGTLFDYPHADGLHKIAQTIWKNGGVVSAVCHGPAIFDNLIDPNTGKPLIEGKTITGFTDAGETVLQVDSLMKDLGLESIEDIAKKLGAHYSAPSGPWDDYSIADGKLVTGVNPQSAASTAKKAIQALNA